MRGESKSANDKEPYLEVLGLARQWTKCGYYHLQAIGKSHVVQYIGVHDAESYPLPHMSNEALPDHDHPDQLNPFIGRTSRSAMGMLYCCAPSTSI